MRCIDFTRTAVELVEFNAPPDTI